MDQRTDTEIRTDPDEFGRPEVILIGSTEVSSATGEIFRGGETGLLGRRALAVLVALAEADGEMVATETLMRSVWPGSIVEHNTLQSHVSMLRKALGPDRDRLETYSGRGYRLRTRLPVSAPASSRPGDPTSPASTRAGSVPGASDNLPTSPSQLIGREAQVASLRSLLRRGSVVTLTGPGGIGKTRLGLETARRSRGEFPGGVFFVDLAAVSTGSEVMTAVLSSIGTQRHFHASIEDRVKGLGQSGALVVMDNCEHVVEVAARVAETIVRSNEAAVVLATSREPLRAEGEYVFRVPGLDLPASGTLGPSALLACDSVKLFMDRSTIGRERLAMREVLAVDIAQICCRLDGNPLAIELAAARADSIGIEEFAMRLDDCLSILVDGRRTALPRHQTLRATLEWSYGLLTRDERKVFHRLAVFAGGFTLSAACRVVRGDEFSESDVLDLLSSLVNKSLVATDADPARRRYRLLETSRAYALEQLTASGEFDGVARAHTRYYTELLDTSDIRTSVAINEFARDRFRPEIDNARAALNWAFSPAGDAQAGFGLASVTVILMYELLLLEECAAVASRALAAMAGRAGTQRMMELRVRTSLAASLVYLRGPVSSTVAAWNSVLSIARELHEAGYELRALWGLWTCRTYAGMPALALRHAQEYASIEQSTPIDVRKSGDRIIGIAHHYLGNHAAARRHLELFISQYQHGSQSVPHATLIDHATLARATLARVLLFCGSLDRARDAAEIAIKEALAAEDPVAICYVAVECALPISTLLQDTTAARRYLMVLRSASEKHGSMFWKLLDQCYQALLDTDGEVDFDALMRLRRGIEGLHDLAFDTYSIDLRNRFAHLLHRVGRIDEALAFANRTLEHARARAEHLWEPELLRTRAWLTIESGGPAADRDAHADLQLALELARAQGALPLELRAATQMAKLLAARGQRAQAQDLLQHVCGRFTEGRQWRDLQEAWALAASLG
jgi:predicted ATPase/DNA-binding winged helix-turn-helix (wHTH) protein